MRFLIRLLPLTLFISLPGCAPDPVDDVLKHITAENLRRHIEVLAHDSLEGRGPATRGEERTVAYLDAQYRALGLEPAGASGSYFQNVPMIGFQLDPSTVLQLQKGNRSLQLRFYDEFVAFTGVHEPLVNVRDAEIVFVGYGIDAPEQAWDDYKGVDVRGKVLLMLNNDPATDDTTLFAGRGRTYYGRWDYKYEVAARKGAAGAIVIHTTESASYPWKVVQTSWSRENFDLLNHDGGPRLKLKAWTSEEATRTYVTLAGFDLDALTAAAQVRSFQPVPLGIKLSTAMRFTIRRLETRNVVGLLRGSDPELSRQVVVLTAHHDHLGIGTPVQGDSIYNGALDNASGVSLMLNIGQALAAMEPRPGRSVLLCAVAAEEYGLRGSEYYATHSTIPLKDIAAVINMDAINIWGKTKDIIFLGSDRSTLGADVEAVAKAMNMEVKPDQFPEHGSFYRSDHFSFAKVGVPCLSMDGGVDYIGRPADFARTRIEEFIGRHYHQPSDELSDDWNYDGAMQQAEFVLRLVKRIGDAREMPRWNAGDEFEAARLQTLSLQ